MNFAENLHLKGELSKVEKMEELQQQIETESNGKLAGAFLTHGYKNKYDCIAIMAQDASVQDEEGNIFYDEDKEEAIFIKDEEE